MPLPNVLAAAGSPSPIEGILARHGLELLGAAHNAFAFAPPDDRSLAIKVGFDPDDGWPAWAEWCRGGRGPHVPKVHAIQWFTSGGRRRIFAASVERLYPTLVGSRFIRACPEGKRDPLALARHVEAGHPEIADLLRSAAGAFPLGHWDMGGPNWLEREDGTLVLNDPLSRA